MPPWNSYDSTTVEALRRAGYRYVSAAWDVPRNVPHVSIPRTTSLPNLKQAIAVARRFGWFSPTVVAVLHDYDFVESQEPEASFRIADLRELLAWVKSQPALRVSTIGDAVRDGLSSGTAMKYNAWRGRFPWRLRGMFPDSVILSNPIPFLGGLSMPLSWLAAAGYHRVFEQAEALRNLAALAV